MKKKTIDELQESGALCEYCEIAENANTHPNNMCESSRCDESYDAYLDEFKAEVIDKLKEFVHCKDESTYDVLYEGVVNGNLTLVPKKGGIIECDVTIGFGGLELKPKTMPNDILLKPSLIHDAQYYKSKEKPKKPVCNPHARKFKHGWSKR